MYTSFKFYGTDFFTITHAIHYKANSELSSTPLQQSNTADNDFSTASRAPPYLKNRKCVATLTTQYINISSNALWSEKIGTSPGSLVTLVDGDWESVEET